jgi:hypothetical protein
MINEAEKVETCSIFHCRDNTDALIKALEIISRRCQREIYGKHTLIDSHNNVITIDSFLDEYGCPQARYDPLWRDVD